MKEKYHAKENENNLRSSFFYVLLSFIEIGLLLLFFFFIVNFSFVTSLVGEPNATVGSFVEIGAAPPIINNITFEVASVDLVPDSNVTVSCLVDILDNVADTNIDTVTAEFFDVSLSSYGAADDNNTHYTNSSCAINYSYGDEYSALANCTFDVFYYANPGTWNCSANVTNGDLFSVQGNNSTSINQLIAIGVPNTINYGTVNATFVSLENISNVTNYGNVPFNISLEGYAQTQGDGYAMNCTLGSSGFISVEHEKFNLTNSTPGQITLAQSEVNYTNLTASPVVYDFELNYRQNDVFNEAINATYWRMFVPLGVAGNCTGNIIFGATQSAGV